MQIRRWIRKLIEGQRAEWGSGFYNVHTGQNVVGEIMDHASTIVDNCKIFDVCHLIPADAWENFEVMNSYKNEIDAQYKNLYDAGWMRYLWAEEPGESFLAGSGTPRLMGEAWSSGLIHRLYQEFQPNISYWNYEGNVPGVSPRVHPPESSSDGEIPLMISDWFEALAGEDEVNDIRRRAGLE